MAENQEEAQDLTDSGLEALLKKALTNVQEDIDEAQKHVKQIAKKIEDPDKKAAIEIYSIMYQEALKVKGVARDRYLKVIKMIQDRVRVKEIVKQGKSSTPWMLTPDAVQDMITAAKDKQDVEKLLKNTEEEKDEDDN